jgi:plasmid replication initiation protein
MNSEQTKNTVNRDLVARIENTLIFGAKYKLLPREQKIVLYLISKIDPRTDRFHEQIVSVKELEQLLKTEGTKWGGLYEEMKSFKDRIVRKGLEFQSDVEIEGRPFTGYISWFQSIIPIRNEAGEVCLEFMFSEKLRPFLLQLKEYTRIDLKEILPLKSGFSIRLLQIFRAQLNRMERHERESKISYSIEDFKSLLDISDSYKDFRNLRKRVLDVVVEEINEKTSVSVDMDFQRAGRKVIAIDFILKDKARKKVKTPKLTLHELSFAQLKAYELLVDYGVNEGIALKQIIPRVKSSEAEGFEDMWIEECLKIFKKKAKGGVGVFVNWFLKLKVFEQGEHFAAIMEGLQERKKKLQKDRPDAWDNRMESKSMSAEKFRELKLG